jgi:VIT1/CCC1 family predicted Fe2+/Mn2+ transporter
MSRESFIFLFGFIVFLTPFLGIPSEWKRIIFIVSGALLMLVGYSLRRASFIRSLEVASGERRGDAFVENVGTRNVINETDDNSEHGEIRST